MDIQIWMFWDQSIGDDLYDFNLFLSKRSLWFRGCQKMFFSFSSLRQKLIFKTWRRNSSKSNQDIPGSFWSLKFEPISDSDFKNRNTDLFHHSSPSRPICRVGLEVGWPSGSTYLLEADRAIASTYRWANLSCVHCTSVGQSRPPIQRRINSLTLLSLLHSTYHNGDCSRR